MSRLDRFEEILKSYEGKRLDVCPSVVFNNMEWEAIAPRKDHEKEAFFYDDSQQRILNAGFERHPLSAEAFALICAYLDDEKNKTNLLTQEQAELAKDMLVNNGEFFCQAIETTQVSDRNIATISELVRVLPRNAENKGYERSGMKCAGTPKTFEVTDLELGTYYYYKNIHNQHNDLIEYITSRKYADLPEEIKETGGIVIPEPGIVGPVGCDDFDDGFSIGSYSSNGASRGVRRAQKKVTA